MSGVDSWGLAFGLNPAVAIQKFGFHFQLAGVRVLWPNFLTMKNIDMKSLLIGGLLASTIFFGVAATSPTDKWDEDQRWEITIVDSSKQKYSIAGGYEGQYERFGKEWDDAAIGAEPFAIRDKGVSTDIFFRKRVK